MKKSRNSTIKKERILMMISSAFVLTALTVTGIYMKGRNEQSRDDGYTIDFEHWKTRFRISMPKSNNK